MSALRKHLFVPDTHRPYHDQRVWALMLKAAQAFKPDVITTLGDFADFYAVSSHSKNPQRAACLEDEIRDVREGLDELGQLGAKELHFVSGNHEDRLDRYIMQNASALWGMANISDVLGLKDKGWKYTPYKRHLTLGKLHITHEVGNAGKYAHYQAQSAFESNVIIGHTHRIGYTVVGNAKGKPHVGAMLGWLGSFEDVDYMHRVKALRDWAHGFGIGYQTSDGAVHVTPVPVVNGRCVVEGRLITSR